jgi:Aerotolerance regulator N-terminal/von Willebrand factor type A domain
MQPWMTFLNASLLIGSAAFSIPLVIHLLNRSRFKTIDWGAMMFIEDVLRANSRRIEWQRWLLLFLRCLIPICLALCMARPLLQNSRLLPYIQGATPSATYLLIDNSLSMDTTYTRPSEPSLSAFELAKQDALGMIRSASRRSRWALDTLGSHSTGSIEFSSRDVERQTAAADALPRRAGSSDIVASLDRALSGLLKSTESQRQIIVLSDFQKSMCDKVDPNQLAAFRQRCESSPVPVSIYFAPVTPSSTSRKPPVNLTVRVDSQTRSVVGVGQPWEVRLIIRNFGTELASGIRLILSVDGTAISSKSLEVPGNAETQLEFGFSFTQDGSHRVEAKLENEDAILADNVAAWSVLALNTIPVLIVDPSLHDRKRSPESEYLSAALAPFTDSADQGSNFFRVTKANPSDLSIDRIRQHQIIILANVPKLTDSLVTPLLNHIHAGGILTIFAGDRIDTEWYNKRLGSLLDRRCLPFLFDKAPQSIDSNEEGLKLRRENFQHPAVSFLNDTRVGSLENLEVRSWYRLLPNSASDDDQVSRLLSLANGDTLMAERAFGDGVILQCATTGNDLWTNWPLRPIFLPLLQQLLLNSTPPIRWQMNVETGQPLSSPSRLVLDWIADRRGEIESDVVEDRLRGMVWQVPDGQKEEGDAIHSEQPGTYSIDGLSESLIYLSAQAPLVESDLEIVSDDGLKSLADRLGASILNSSDELVNLETHGSQELWRWFLLGLLLLLFGELFLQRRFSGVAA